MLSTLLSNIIITHITLNYISKSERIIEKIENITTKNYLNYQKNLINEIHTLSFLCGISKNINYINAIVTVKESCLDEKSKIISNIKQALEYIFKSEGIKTNISYNDVLHIVKLIQNEIIEEWFLGAIRSVNQSPKNNTYEINKNNVFDNKITNYLADIILWINNDDHFHPIIKSSILLYFINFYLPFFSLNYISSLVLFKSVLVRFGYETNKNIPLLQLFEFIKLNFSKELEEIIKNQNLSYLIEIISFGYFNLVNYYYQKYSKLLRTNHDYSSTLIELKLNKRQKEFLKLLYSNKFLTKKDYMKTFNVSSMTAYRELKKLTELNLIKTEGKSKSTRYFLI